MTRILIVTLGIPHPARSGRQIRDFHLARELARRADVHVLSVLMEDDDTDPSDIRRVGEWEMHPIRRGPAASLAALRYFGMPVATRSFYAPAVAARIRRIADDSHATIVQIEHSFLACYRSAIPARCKSVLSFHNVGSQQYQRMAAIEGRLSSRLAALGKAKLMGGWEPRIAAQFDAVVAVSAREAALLSPPLPAAVITVVENGVDCQTLRPLSEPDGDPLLIFTGVMGYPPNADAVVGFCRETLPLIRRRIPTVRLVIVGQAPPESVRRLDGRDGVRVTGEVPATEPFYRSATIAIVPLRAGGGTRLKILEAMALGRPVVSTSVGCEGLGVEHGRDLLVADSPSDFAEAVVRLLEDPALRRSLVAHARQVMEDRYDWRVVAIPLIALHRRLVA